MLWYHWWNLVCELRSACARTRTFLWMSLCLAGISTRKDLLGVTSIVRALGLEPACYDRLLDFFHSPALDLNGSIAECVGKGAAIARLVVQGRQQGKNVSWNLGALPPNPRNLALSGQNSCWAWTTMEALERRIGLRRNATRAPSQAPEWLGRLPSAP